MAIPDFLVMVFLRTEKRSRGKATVERWSRLPGNVARRGKASLNRTRGIQRFLAQTTPYRYTAYNVRITLG